MHDNHHSDSETNSDLNDWRLLSTWGRLARELDDTSSKTSAFKLFNAGIIPFSPLLLTSARRKNKRMLKQWCKLLCQNNISELSDAKKNISLGRSEMRLCSTFLHVVISGYNALHAMM